MRKINPIKTLLLLSVILIAHKSTAQLASDAVIESAIPEVLDGDCLGTGVYDSYFQSELNPVNYLKSIICTLGGNGTIYINSKMRIDSDLNEIPEGIRLVFGPSGVLINDDGKRKGDVPYAYINSSKLTIKGPIDASTGIFNTTRNIQIDTNYDVNPKWWCDVTTNSNHIVNSSALNAMNQSLKDTKSANVIIDEKIVLTSDVTLNENIKLKFVINGLFDINEGSKLTCNSLIYSDLIQIFKGEGKVLATNLSGLDKIYPEWWGATSDDESNDDSEAIQKAIDFTSNSGGGVVHISNGTYDIHKSIKLKSYVTLKGIKAENGWARVDENKFYMGSRIKVYKDKLCSAITADKIYNWGIQNLIIDGNEQNQGENLPSEVEGAIVDKDAAGYHGIEIKSSEKSHGGVISHCKIVNPVNYGIYCYNSRVMEIRDNFIMSGLFIGAGADLNVTGNSIDGTHGKHPALYLADIAGANFSNNLIWGAGEKSDDRLSEEKDDNGNILPIPEKSKYYYNYVKISSNEDLKSNTLSNTLTSTNKQGLTFESSSDVHFLYQNMPIVIRANEGIKPYYIVNEHKLKNEGASNESGGQTYYLNLLGTKTTEDDGTINTWEIINRPSFVDFNYGVTINTTASDWHYYANHPDENKPSDNSDTLSYFENGIEVEIHPGNQSAALITKCKNMRLTSNRIAGSAKSGLTLQKCKDIIINSNTFTRMNLIRDPSITGNYAKEYGIELYDTEYCTIVGNSIGEQGNSTIAQELKYVPNGKSNIDHAIIFKDKFTYESRSNNTIGLNTYSHYNEKEAILDESPNSQNIIMERKFFEKYTVFPYVLDSNLDIVKNDGSTVSYSESNDNIALPIVSQITPIDLNAASPLIIPNRKNTGIRLKVNQSPKKQESFFDKQIPLDFKKGQTYRIQGQIAFNYDGCDLGKGGCIGEIIVKAFILNSSKTVNLEKNFIGRKDSPERLGNEYDYPLIIPIDFSYTKMDDSDNTLMLQVFNNLGKPKSNEDPDDIKLTEIRLDSNDKYSWITIEKIE